MKKLFIIVDMQNDFITGSLNNKEAEKIVGQIVQKIKSLNKKEYEIFVTQDTHNDDYLETQEGKNLPVKHCIKDTFGWEINEEILKALSGFSVTYIPKNTFGCLFWGNKRFESIEMCGVCTDICVVSNALILKAKYPETEVIVYENLCAGTSKTNHDAAILTMKNCQVKIK